MRRISKEKRWEREKMRGRLVVGGPVSVLRGERKKEEKKNGGLGEVVQLPSPQENEKMERPNRKK